MRNKLYLLTFSFILVISITATARPVNLKPGTKITVAFNEAREIQPNAHKSIITAASAELTISLDNTGTLLTATIKNTSQPQSGISLYALDLGISEKTLNDYQFETTLIDFPTGARWAGPSDSPGLSGTFGTFLLMAVEALPMGGKELLKPLSPLPASFLNAGQSGSLQVQFINQGKAKDLQNRILGLAPTVHFLAPATMSLQADRLRLLSDNMEIQKASSSMGLLLLSPLLLGALFGLSKLRK